FPQNDQLPKKTLIPPAPLMLPVSVTLPVLLALLLSRRSWPSTILLEIVIVFAPAKIACGPAGELPACTVISREKDDTVGPKLSMARTVPEVSPSRMGEVPVPSAPALLMMSPPTVESAPVDTLGFGPPPRI